MGVWGALRVLTMGRWWSDAIEGVGAAPRWIPRHATQRNAVSASQTRVSGVAGGPSFWSGAPTCIRVTGHRRLRSRRGGGNSTMFGKTASLYGVIRSASARLLPPKGTLAYCNQGRGPAGAFLLCDHHQAQAVDRKCCRSSRVLLSHSGR